MSLDLSERVREVLNLVKELRFELVLPLHGGHHFVRCGRLPDLVVSAGRYATSSQHFFVKSLQPCEAAADRVGNPCE
ncbi:MAG: hypothetical protein Q8M79_00825 [Dehalococcoidia bacterium]|nr:hypothetical protein [Dehalococcoidia bacterium]